MAYRATSAAEPRKDYQLGHDSEIALTSTFAFGGAGDAAWTVQQVVN
jgi:hypothetical protein